MPSRAIRGYDGAALPAPLTEAAFLTDALARTASDGVLVANVIPSRAAAVPGTGLPGLGAALDRVRAVGG